MLPESLEGVLVQPRDQVLVDVQRLQLVDPAQGVAGKVLDLVRRQRQRLETVCERKIEQLRCR